MAISHLKIIEGQNSLAKKFVTVVENPKPGGILIIHHSASLSLSMWLRLHHHIHNFIFQIVWWCYAFVQPEHCKFGQDNLEIWNKFFNIFGCSLKAFS